MVAEKVLAFHFPHTDAKDFVPIGRKLPDERLDEIADLVWLMLIDKTDRSTSEVWMARIVAAGCMAPDHLWHDLGLGIWGQILQSCIDRVCFEVWPDHFALS